MKKMIEGFFYRRGKKNLNLNKKYRWYLPKELINTVDKGDIVGVIANNKLVPFFVDDILEWDRKFYNTVIKVIHKNSDLIEETGIVEKPVYKKYKRLSEKDKEEIRTMKANGKKLREIAEIYNYSISSIHRIINEK